jgi:hypothetical protein
VLEDDIVRLVAKLTWIFPKLRECSRGARSH